MKVLKPCPFCGGENIFVDEYEQYAGTRCRVVCLDCMATLDDATIHQKFRVNVAWNRRFE